MRTEIASIVILGGLAISYGSFLSLGPRNVLYHLRHSFKPWRNERERRVGSFMTLGGFITQAGLIIGKAWGPVLAFFIVMIIMIIRRLRKNFKRWGKAIGAKTRAILAGMKRKMAERSRGIRQPLPQEG